MMTDEPPQSDLALLLAEIARLHELVGQLQASGQPIPFEADEELIRVEEVVRQMVKGPTMQ